MNTFLILVALAYGAATVLLGGRALVYGLDGRSDEANEALASFIGLVVVSALMWGVSRLIRRMRRV